MTNRVNYIPASFIASDEGRRYGGVSQSRLDSENEDLRGVIDDLTIENKKLKQMIRMQQSRKNTPSDNSQQQDKLFEVRMHGLPPEKRRELEYLLKNFATSVHTSISPNKPTSSTNASIATSSSGQNNPAIKTDSGYASNSNSGKQSSVGGLGSSLPKTSTTKAVKSYLQDIPDTLLPKHNPIMSERAKSALVVRRLEQLFTGRKASPGDHDQPRQQQEISQNAARMDRMQDARNNKRKRPEGNREAHVYPPDTKVNLDIFDADDGKDLAVPGRLKTDNPFADGTLISRPGSPDQRPTRPLDLDIHRAQIAAENVQYIRHLGLSFPQLGVTMKDIEESPWMYLNLLSGLAQLHTLNVTPDFTRRAVKKLSRQFELSKDGHKVRWVGGLEGTKFNTEDEKAIEAAEISPQDSNEDGGTGGSSKRSKTNSSSNAAVGSTPSSEDKTSGQQTSSDSKQQTQLTTSGTSNMLPTEVTKRSTVSSAFDYKPIVYKVRSKTDEDDLLRDSDESFDSQSGDSSGLAHALSKSNLNQKSKEEGSITFYNNAHFCSDFSSDAVPSNILRQPRVAVMGETLGIPIPAENVESPLRYHDATYFFTPTPQYSSSKLEDSKLNLDCPPLETISEAGEEETVPRELGVCGLGGVYPEDNFALDVQVHINKAPISGPKTIAKRMPFSRRRYLQKYAFTVESCHKIDLLPSKLPPPSYIFFTSSSSSDAPDMEDISDGDSDGSSSPLVDEEYPAPPAFLMQFSGSSRDNLGDDEDDDESKSSEIDMLALARQVNPRQIAEQERVYMMNEPMGAQRAVAGSLAATVGASRSSHSNHEAVMATSSASNHSDQGSAESSDSDDDKEMDDE